MKTILFIATYPQGLDIRDGMAQRIAAVDEEFKDYNRIYLSLSLNNKYREDKLSSTLTQYYLNPLVHSQRIKELIKASDMQYMHSIHNSVRFIPFIKLCSNLVLDVHGVVPEESKLKGDKIKSIIYNWIEKMCFQYIKSAVVVSDAMRLHFISKYPERKKLNYTLKTIYPSNILNTTKNSSVEDLKRNIGIKESDVVVLYSGNTQKWQNIDLMLDCINKMLNPNYFFIILTQNKEEMEKKCEFLAGKVRILIDSVAPNELEGYYNLANYGFVLRDNITINRVAAPTKIIEYLNYGLTPIVKCEEIGDWKKEGYEYISINDDLNNLTSKKSKKNEQLAKLMYQRNKSVKLKDLLNCN